MIAVRILREGTALREAVFASLPVSLGRGPESDVVLLDASVSRVHARIEADDTGAIVLRDLGSRNGIHVGNTRVTAAPVTGLLRCQIGRVEVEVEAVSETNTSEFRVHDWDGLHKRRTLADQLRYLFVGAAAWLLAVVLDPTYWSPWNKGRLVSLLWNGLGIAVALPLLAFGLLVALKAAGRRVRVADTLQAGSHVLWLWPLWAIVSTAVYYVLPGPAYTVFELVMLGVMLVAGAVHLVSVRRAGPSKRFWVVWATAVGALYLGLYTTGTVAGRKSGAPATDHHVQPPLGRFTGPSEPLDRYLERLGRTAGEAAKGAEAVRVEQAD